MSGSATMYTVTGLKVQLLTHLVVDMQLLPGVDVSSLTGVDVKYLACESGVDVSNLEENYTSISLSTSFVQMPCSSE